MFSQRTWGLRRRLQAGLAGLLWVWASVSSKMATRPQPITEAEMKAEDERQVRALKAGDDWIAVRPIF